MCGGNVEKDNVSREGNKNYTGEGGANILQREIYGGRKSLFVEWEVELERRTRTLRYWGGSRCFFKRGMVEDWWMVMGNAEEGIGWERKNQSGDFSPLWKGGGGGDWSLATNYPDKGDTAWAMRRPARTTNTNTNTKEYKYKGFPGIDFRTSMNRKYIYLW